MHEHPADRSLGAEARAVVGGGQSRSYVALAEESGPDTKRSFLRSFWECGVLSGQDIEMLGENQLESLQYYEGEKDVAVFGATSAGSLWWCPGKVSIGLGRPQEFGLHIGRCLDIQLNPSAAIAVTAGEDGTIFVLRVSGLEGGQAETTDTDVVMISRGEIQSQEEEIQRLIAEQAQLKVRQVEDSAKIQTECIARVTAARTQDQEEIRSLRLKCETLQQAATQHERESLRQIKAMEAEHVHAAEHKEAMYDKRIRKEAERFAAVHGELREQVNKLEAMRTEAQRKLQAQRARQQQEVERLVGDKETEVQRLKDLIAFTQQRFDMMLDQESMEHDLELAELARKNDAELEKQRFLEYQLKKEQDTILRGLDMMENEKQRVREEDRETNNVIHNLHTDLETLKGKVAALKVERRDREATLREKELEIGSYKSKVNTLKKFKQVLDFRLREVTRSLQPKDDTIADLGVQLRELEEQFEEHLESHKEMEASLRDMDDQLKTAGAECSKLRDTIKQRDRTIWRFTEDLRDLATNETDVRKWPDLLRDIYWNHAKPELLSKDAGGQANQELARQIKSTEKKAHVMMARGKAEEEKNQADIRRKTDRNSELIEELDALRRERKELNIKKKRLELDVKEAEHRLGYAQQQQHALQDRVAAPTGSRSASRCGAASPSPPMVQGLFGASAQSQLVVASSPEPPSGGGSGGKLRRAGGNHRTPEERKRMQKLLATVDLRNQTAQMQRLEIHLLQGQRDHLVSVQGGSNIITTRAAAGVGSTLVPAQINLP